MLFESIGTDVIVLVEEVDDGGGLKFARRESRSVWEKKEGLPPGFEDGSVALPPGFMLLLANARRVERSGIDVMADESIEVPAAELVWLVNMFREARTSIGPLDEGKADEVALRPNVPSEKEDGMVPDRSVVLDVGNWGRPANGEVAEERFVPGVSPKRSVGLSSFISSSSSAFFPSASPAFSLPLSLSLPLPVPFLLVWLGDNLPLSSSSSSMSITTFSPARRFFWGGDDVRSMTSESTFIFESSCPEVFFAGESAVRSMAVESSVLVRVRPVSIGFSGGGVVDVSIFEDVAATLSASRFAIEIDGACDSRSRTALTVICDVREESQTTLSSTQPAPAPRFSSNRMATHEVSL